MAVTGWPGRLMLACVCAAINTVDVTGRLVSTSSSSASSGMTYSADTQKMLQQVQQKMHEEIIKQEVAKLDEFEKTKARHPFPVTNEWDEWRGEAWWEAESVYEVLDDTGGTMLHQAVAIGDATRTKDLLDRGAEVDQRTVAGSAWQVDHGVGSTALMLAALEGHVEVVTQLIAAGATLDLRNDNGNTALFLAAAKGHSHVVRVLLRAGAAVGRRGSGMLDDKDKSDTPLTRAARSGHADVVAELLKGGASVNDRAEPLGYTALQLSILHGPECGGIKSTPPTPDTNAPLRASEWKDADHRNRRSHLQVFHMLVSAGAELESRSDMGETALVCAVSRGCLDIVETLILKGADVNQPLTGSGHIAMEGQSPVSIAAGFGRFEVVKQLAHFGADLNTVDKNGNSPMNWAFSTRQTETAEWIRNYISAGDRRDRKTAAARGRRERKNISAKGHVQNNVGGGETIRSDEFIGSARLAWAYRICYAFSILGLIYELTCRYAGHCEFLGGPAHVGPLPEEEHIQAALPRERTHGRRRGRNQGRGRRQGRGRNRRAGEENRARPAEEPEVEAEEDDADDEHHDANAAGLPFPDIPEVPSVPTWWTALKSYHAGLDAEAERETRNSGKLYKCPITHEIMHTPALIVSGGVAMQNYEYSAIHSWIFGEGNVTEPLTNEPLVSPMIVRNQALEREIRTWARGLVKKWRAEESRTSTGGTDEPRQDVHVFVDHSNITLGARDVGRQLDVAKLVKWVEGARRVHERVVRGSSELSRDRAEWEKLNFSVSAEFGRGKEQFVDDALHAALMQTAGKTFGPPRVLALLTGDGNSNDGRTTFPECVERAVVNGWKVELITWRHRMARKYATFEQCYTDRFRIRYIDDHDVDRESTFSYDHFSSSTIHRSIFRNFDQDDDLGNDHVTNQDINLDTVDQGIGPCIEHSIDLGNDHFTTDDFCHTPEQSADHRVIDQETHRIVGQVIDDQETDQDAPTFHYDNFTAQLEVTCPRGHLLRALGSSANTGWSCSGMDEPGGCVQGCTGFHQTEGWDQYRCEICDYDLCQGCFDRHEEEISTSMENRIRADFDSSLGEGGGFSFENFVDWPPLSWSGSTAGPKTR